MSILFDCLVEKVFNLFYFKYFIVTLLSYL